MLTRTCLAFVLLLTVQSTAIAAEPVSEKDARARANALFDDLGGGPEQDLAALLDKHFSPVMRERVGDDRLLDILGMLSGDFEGMNAKTAIESFADDNNDWRLVINTLEEQRLGMLLTIGSGPDFQIEGFGIRPLPPEIPVVATEDLPGAIDAYMRTRVAERDFSGSVLVAQGNDIVYGKAFGLADESTGRKNTLDTPINLGSMNKMFTGLAIGQLVAQGKLNYLDTVGKHLPGYPNATARDKVTVQQLLTHTSGVPSYWNDAYDAQKDEISTLSGFLVTFMNEPLSFEPGTDNQYSNGGPVILGLIIEKLTGMDYYAYIRENIYLTAGMKNTGHYLTHDKSVNFAIGYIRDDNNQLRDNKNILGLRGSAAGGGYASANDLLKFSKSLRAKTVASKETLEELWKPFNSDNPEFGYGYLWGTGILNGQRWVGHNGGAPGVSAEYAYFPEIDLTVVVLANRDHAATPVYQWLTAVISQPR